MNPTGQATPETAGWAHLTGLLMLAAVAGAQSGDHPLRMSGALAGCPSR